MDPVRPQRREQRFSDCASLDWPTGPHPTPSGSGPAPTADRSKTPAAGLAHEGLTPQGPLQKTRFRMYLFAAGGVARRRLGAGARLLFDVIRHGSVTDLIGARHLLIADLRRPCGHLLGDLMRGL